MIKWYALLLIVLASSCSRGPTFSEDIAPILAKNCSGCHNPKGIGPFSLLSYNQVKTKSKTIEYMTANRFMPPWPADQNYSHFLGERGLSQTEINTIQR